MVALLRKIRVRGVRVDTRVTFDDIFAMYIAEYFENRAFLYLIFRISTESAREITGSERCLEIA